MPFYASFWKRAAACLVDSIICGIISWVVSFAIGLAFAIGSMSTSEPDVMMSLVLNLVSFVLGVIIFVLYYAWPESSSWQASIGKKLFNLQVTDMYGQRISFWRAVGRNLGKYISGLILCIGYLMCFWTEKKQCLHDMMAGCLVIDQTPNEKQGCMVAVFVVYGVLLLIGIVGIVLAVALAAGAIQH